MQTFIKIRISCQLVCTNKALKRKSKLYYNSVTKCLTGFLLSEKTKHSCGRAIYIYVRTYSIEAWPEAFTFEWRNLLRSRGVHLMMTVTFLGLSL